MRGQIAYICEVSIEEGSDLDGAKAQEAIEIGSHRMIAHRRGRSEVKWNYDPALVMGAGDELLVLATRAGLDKILQRCRPVGAAAS